MPEKNKAAQELGRLGGLKGGKARAEKLSPEERSAIARKAAQARWAVEGGESWEAMMSLATRYDVKLPERPPSWFERQARQRPVRATLEEMRVERVRRRLMRWLVEPEIAGIPEPGERAAEATLAWDRLSIAQIIVARVRENAR
jgi:hypothetical protein